MKKHNIILFTKVERHEKFYKLIVLHTGILVKNVCKCNYFQCVPSNYYVY